MALKQYDPRDVIVTWGSILFRGFSDGTFVTIEYDEDAVSKHTGAKGDVTATISANRGGMSTVTLGQASPVNDQLSAIAAIQRQQGAGLQKYPFMVKHINGTTLASAAEAWIKKQPNTEFGDDHSPREWPFDFAELEMFVGGSVR